MAKGSKRRPSDMVSKQFNENFDKIFGMEDCETGCFTYVDGELRRLSKGLPEPKVHLIMDIEPYQSPVTGEFIGSRKAHREDLERNNCRHFEGMAEEQKYADIHVADQDKKFDSVLDDALRKTANDIKYGNTEVEKGPLVFD